MSILHIVFYFAEWRFAFAASVLLRHAACATPQRPFAVASIRGYAGAQIRDLLEML
jgi:hypothetical protein